MEVVAAPPTPEPRVSEGSDGEATPDALKQKSVSPGPKDDPLRRDRNPAPQPEPDPVVRLGQHLRSQLQNVSDDQVFEDNILRQVFDYDAVYGILGSTAETMEAAVYAIFSRMFKNWSQEGAFRVEDAYRFYDKFPVSACATLLSAARYKTIAQKLCVDPHFVRFPRVQSMKMLLPHKWRVMFESTLTQGPLENVMMLGGTNMKKSTILKLWRSILRNPADHETIPGVDAFVKELGMKRMVKVKKGDSRRSAEDEDEAGVEEEADFVEDEGVFWYFFNPRMTYEGLIDIGNAVYTDGPRVHLAMDELTLCVSGVGRKGAQGCLSMDEFILFCDDEAECSKGAVITTRRLKNPFFTSCVGVQHEVLPEILGSNPGRNVLARYTIVATQEYKGLEEMSEEVA